MNILYAPHHFGVSGINRDWSGRMSLTVSVRKPNHVAILDCVGRIVAGDESTCLENAVRKWMADHCDVVLNLSGVDFIDSSGLGLLVRLATSTRNNRVGLRFCNAGATVRRVISLTMLDSVLQPYPTEVQAIHSLAQKKASSASGPLPGNIVLCADDSPDLLACLREGLGCAGYHVHSASILPDALMLLKAIRPRVLIAGPRFAEKLNMRALEMKIPVLRLSENFCMTDAGEAIGDLVCRLNTVLGQV